RNYSGAVEAFEQVREALIEEAIKIERELEELEESGMASDNPEQYEAYKEKLAKRSKEVSKKLSRVEAYIKFSKTNSCKSESTPASSAIMEEVELLEAVIRSMAEGQAQLYEEFLRLQEDHKETLRKYRDRRPKEVIDLTNMDLQVLTGYKEELEEMAKSIPALRIRSEEGKIRILFVDDDKAIRLSLVGWLTDEGYSVVTAPNGVVGLWLVREKAKANQAQFDLVITDQNMPEMEGSTLAV
ncbi:unnamed protein product, partial [marine sediment metagenome]